MEVRKMRGWGRRRGQCTRLGFSAIPFGFMRFLKAREVGDPARAFFGLGPCGEAAYQAYKSAKEKKQQKTQEQ
jgi:hypothetical protein